MGLIRGVLDRILLIAAILAGGCVPSFVTQYRQRIGGRLDQVLSDLAPFEQIAQRDFGGSLQALIQHHTASTDPTFAKEGAAVQQMVDTAARLREALQALGGDLFHQVGWLLGHLDFDVARATWAAWQPSFSLSPEGLVFALIAGVAVWIVFLLIWHAIAAVARPRVEGSQFEVPHRHRRIAPRGWRT